MNYRYQLNCGQYVLHDGDKPLSGPYDTVALCFDREDGTLHKHGNPQMVRNWHQKTTARLRDGGMPELADTLVVFEGRFEIKDLNRCIDTSGYAKVLYDRFMSGALTHQPLDQMG